MPALVAAPLDGRIAQAHPDGDARPRPLRTPLAVGDRAWCFLAAPLGRGKRETLVGAAQGRVVAIAGDVHHVELLLVSVTTSDRGAWFRPGLVIESSRAALWSATCPLEHAAFAVEVMRFWPSSSASRSSPP